ncbi:hypothetical protein P4C99_09310 [Pontiellaceae bacterium B1224]|nr:hypothetical protein [Pontiellaceae bacterium B1224]
MRALGRAAMTPTDVQLDLIFFQTLELGAEVADAALRFFRRAGGVEGNEAGQPQMAPALRYSAGKMVFQSVFMLTMFQPLEAA